MNILIPIIITSIAGFSTMLGNVLLFINSKYKDKLISFSLGLSFIVMFLISILELVPEGISIIYGSIPNLYLFILCLLLLGIGYLIVVFIEGKINNENSHSHTLPSNTGSTTNSPFLISLIFFFRIP